ncbi:MAG TPA: hypothetical protein VJ437_05110 [Acidiferrobacterales bacterium]|nr:hypothetical protein [Acidiferrobacterales bacterium]
MISPNLENLAKIGKLKKERVSQTEFDGLVKSGRARLADAHTSSLSIESRFDLAYNASHALALAALRWHGYRSENRYLVFQCLQDTLGLGPEHWRVLALCHERRNVAEYQGHLDVEERLVTDLIRVTETLSEKVSTLGKVT